jgi:hypothetical protein
MVQNDVTTLLFKSRHLVLVFSFTGFISIILVSMTPLAASLLEQPTPLYILLGTSAMGVLVCSCLLKIRL